MFRFDPSNNRPELPIEIEQCILKNLGLFNQNSARVMQVCWSAHESIQHCKTNPSEVIASLLNLSVADRVKAGLNSLEAATCLVKDDILRISLGKYDIMALGFYHSLKDKIPHRLNLISGTYLKQLGDKHLAIRDYLMTSHKELLNPESVKVWEEQQKTMFFMPEC